MLPSLQFLKQIQQQILSIPNQRKETKRREHYGLFLLCQKAGLRVSEAINFDLSKKTHNGLYRIEKSKGKKERLAYIPKKVISELKKHDWKPNRTNRFNFYHFLKKIKQAVNLPVSTELTPHTLRRSFATYHAEAGLPLPLLQKLLGHQSIRTTALYWINIYNDDSNDINDVFAGKNWLEKPKQPQPEPKAPIKINSDGLPELLIPDLPLFSPRQTEHLSKINQLEKQLSQIQQENNNLKSELAQEKDQNANLQNDLSNLSHQNATLYQEKVRRTTEQNQIQQELTIAKETISQLTQDLTNERGKTTATESNLAQEKQINQSLRETNTILTQKLSHSEQTITNLQNAYQKAIKDKELAQKQLNNLIQEIKIAAQQFHQWQKINYYHQQAKQNEFKAQIIHPPPWKLKN